MTADRLTMELYQPCGPDCQPDAHAVLVFTELGVSRDDVMALSSRHGDVLDAQEAPDAMCDWDDELPDGWRVWYRVSPDDHPTAQQHRNS